MRSIRSLMFPWALSLICGVSLCTALPASAGAIGSVVVFGDSLSDNGNLYAATGNTVPPPSLYFEGRRSDGRVAVEYLAASLGATLVDTAFIGATTGLGNYADGGSATSFGAFGLPGMLAEFANAKPALQLLPPAALASTLFVVWGGANDLLAPAPEDGGDLPAIIARAVANELALVDALHGLGAQRVLVPGLPSLGATPYFRDYVPGGVAIGTFFSSTFNTQLAQGLLGTGAQYFDVAGVVDAIIADPLAYGLTNVTQSCFDSEAAVPDAPCPDPEHYLFYDAFHPTTAAHRIVAAAMRAQVVPAPSTLSVLVFALAAFFVRRRAGVR